MYVFTVVMSGQGEPQSPLKSSESNDHNITPPSPDFSIYSS